MRIMTIARRVATATVVAALAGSAGCDNSATDLDNVSLLGEWIYFSAEDVAGYGLYRRFAILTVSEVGNGAITGSVLSTEDCSGRFQRFDVAGEYLVPDIALPMDSYGNVFRGKIAADGDRLVGTLYREPAVFQRYDASVALTSTQACRAFLDSSGSGSAS